VTDPARSTVRAGSVGFMSLLDRVGRVPSAGYPFAGMAGDDGSCPVSARRRPAAIGQSGHPGIIRAGLMCPPGRVSHGEWDFPLTRRRMSVRVTLISLTMG